MYRIPLSESLFGKEPQVVLQSDEFTVTAFAYPQNIAALKIANSRGFVEVLPLMGQIIWDAVFDGKSLRMDNIAAHEKHVCAATTGSRNRRYLRLLRLPFRAADRRLPLP